MDIPASTKAFLKSVFFITPVAITCSGADFYISVDRNSFVPFTATEIGFLLFFSVAAAIVYNELYTDGAASLIAKFRERQAILICFSMVVVLYLIGGLFPDANWIDGGKYIFLPLYTLVMLILVFIYASTDYVEKYRRVIFLMPFIIIITTLAIDVIDPATFSKLESRPAGLQKNPNLTASNIVMLTALIVSWKRFRWWDVLVWVAAGVSVGMTLSRGGVGILFLLYLLNLICIVLELTPKARSLVLIRQIAIVILVILAVAVFAHSSRSNVLAFDQRMQSVIDILSFDFDRVMQDSRIALIGEYTMFINAAPILGHGTGSYHFLPQTPHNIYLRTWTETGIFGLMAYVSFLLALLIYFIKMKDKRGICLTIILISYGFFTELIWDNRTNIVTLGVAVMVAGRIPRNILGFGTSGHQDNDPKVVPISGMRSA